MEQAGELDVAGELGLARELERAVGALDALSYGGHRWSRTSTRESSRDTYPVQRQRLPFIAAATSARSPPVPRAARALAVSSIPAVQKPHCTAACRRKAAAARWWKSEPTRPSIVVTSRPSMSAAR